MGSSFSLLAAGAAALAAALLPASPDPAPSSAAEGWRSLFDGTSLEGWTETGGPYDGDADWTVEDGVIVGREAKGARGGLLYTESMHQDFEFECDVRITAPFDSGIFVRMAPGQRGAQFTLDDRPGGEICGIYSNGWLFHESGGDAAWRSDTWCHVKVRCQGDPMHLMAWIDGAKVLDYRIPEGVDDFASTGRIGIQVHGGMNDPPDAAVRFKNLRVRDLAPAEEFVEDESGAMALTPVGAANGWEPLFNGEDLTGWRVPGAPDRPMTVAEGLAAGLRVQDGQLQALMKGSAPFVRTARTDWQDFELRMDFKIARLANSGLYIRSIDDGSNPSFNGSEIQILDDYNWESASGSKLKAYQFTGGLYGAVAAPKPTALAPIGEWNRYHVQCVGSRMQCALNGTILWDVDVSDVAPEQGATFAERAAAGFIGMQRHGSAAATEAEVGAAFRNVFVRELEVATPRATAGSEK